MRKNQNKKKQRIENSTSETTEIENNKKYTESKYSDETAIHSLDPLSLTHTQAHIWYQLIERKSNRIKQLKSGTITRKRRLAFEQRTNGDEEKEGIKE